MTNRYKFTGRVTHNGFIMGKTVNKNGRYIYANNLLPKSIFEEREGEIITVEVTLVDDKPSFSVFSGNWKKLKTIVI